jgi:hypothetical protein
MKNEKKTTNLRMIEWKEKITLDFRWEGEREEKWQETRLLQKRNEMNQGLQRQLEMTRNRMKQMADKKRTERTFKLETGCIQGWNLLCGPAPCDGGTTTLIKEAAGCLFGLN